MQDNKIETGDKGYGDASEDEWDMIRAKFGPDIVYYPDIFRHFVSELRAGRLDEQLGITLH
ncbi:hypothetical protein [Rhizobium sp. MHM7A]|uniref:hypothetical protein n=1 Tax=Rhizobium sp. MHM7A TaxID=2583233 RepID=UPI00110609E7|nr:hypothetical protein [Rhizobium sp. MHM7A]TLX15764.1 hypothetical protein FFR93_00150 [Rhizobium sp. MHM7A]